MRVLLVEDEVRLAENVANALRDGPGFAVDCAEDGTTGAHLASDPCYDLIVLDLMLPGMDGLSLLKRLRARGVGTPVLILTARNEAGSVVELLNAGMGAASIETLRGRGYRLLPEDLRSDS